jgi:phage terminase small subunit
MEFNRSMDNKDQLTPQQERFCHEYIVDLNATQAAIRASYSEDTARQQASRLLSNVNVQQIIYKLNQERLKETKIDANFVLEELHKIANSSVKDMVDDDGAFLPIKQMPDHIAKTIQAIDVEEAVETDSDTGEVIKTSKTIKVKLWSKDKSLENLGKHLKLFTDKLEVAASMTLENIIGKSMKDKK